MKKFMAIFIFLFIFAGCGIPQEEHFKILDENQQLKDEITRLNGELDEYKYGEKRILALLDQAIKADDVTSARANIVIFNEYHPESTSKTEYTRLLSLVEQQEQKIREAKEAEDRERIRLERLANIGKTPDNPLIIDCYNIRTDTVIQSLLLDKEQYLNKYITLKALYYEEFGFRKSSSTDASIGGSNWFGYDETYKFSNNIMNANDFTFYFNPSDRESRAWVLEMNGKYYRYVSAIDITGKLKSNKWAGGTAYMFVVTSITRNGITYNGTIP
jgi:hypothetical protein